jgi:hypothetical protein
MYCVGVWFTENCTPATKSARSGWAMGRSVTVIGRIATIAPSGSVPGSIWAKAPLAAATVPPLLPTTVRPSGLAKRGMINFGRIARALSLRKSLSVSEISAGTWRRKLPSSSASFGGVGSSAHVAHPHQCAGLRGAGRARDDADAVGGDRRGDLTGRRRGRRRRIECAEDGYKGRGHRRAAAILHRGRHGDRVDRVRRQQRGRVEGQAATVRRDLERAGHRPGRGGEREGAVGRSSAPPAP